MSDSMWVKNRMQRHGDSMYRKFLKIRQYYRLGRLWNGHEEHVRAQALTVQEQKKRPRRGAVINYLLSRVKGRPRYYLEIGVRDIKDNFSTIEAEHKYGVDPGYEREQNEATFKMTSNEFFSLLDGGELLRKDIRFDVIFIDGLHLANQAYCDLQNSLRYVRDDGFVVLHDCNPPTEYHARESFKYMLSPAGGQWNGTVWKAVYRARLDRTLSVCVIDSDFGVGVVSKQRYFPPLEEDINPFYEYNILDLRRKEALNLLTFAEFRNVIDSK